MGLATHTSAAQVVALLQDQRLRHLLPVLPHRLGQDHEALLLALDEAVEGVVQQGVELHPLADTRGLHHQRRVADPALQQDLDQPSQEGRNLLHCLAPLDARDAQGVHHCPCLPLQHLLPRDQRDYAAVPALEGLPEHVQHRPLEGVEAADGLEECECGFEVCVYEGGCGLEGLQVEVDDALEGEFLGPEQVEELVEAVVFVELGDLVGEFVVHGEVAGGVVKASHHVPEAVLQGEHLPLQRLLLLRSRLPLLPTGGQLADERAHAVLEFPGLGVVGVPGEVVLRFVLIILVGEVVAMRFVLYRSRLVVHDND